MIIVITETTVCHVDATRCQYYAGRLELFKGKRQVGEFNSGEWKWAYAPSRDADEMHPRILMKAGIAS